jgi:hypothetical protein
MPAEVLMSGGPRQWAAHRTGSSLDSHPAGSTAQAKAPHQHEGTRAAHLRDRLMI